MWDDVCFVTPEWNGKAIRVVFKCNLQNYESLMISYVDFNWNNVERKRTLSLSVNLFD